MSHPPSGGALLLAAGFSRRFGSDKRRHPLDDGTPLVIASLRLHAAAFDHVLVVLRPDDEAVIDAVEGERGVADTRVILAPDARLGMGHSLARGAEAAHGWDYLFVALADMAWIRRETLSRLRAAIEAAPGDTVLQPRYHGSPGHPVGFGGRYLAALTRLTGDEGARSVVAAAGDDLIRLEVDDPGVLQDLDVPPPDAPAP